MFTVINGQWFALDSGTQQRLLSVYFSDADTGYASGEMGTLLKTTDGGDNWISLSSGTNAAFDAIVFTSSSVGYAFGRGGLIIKTVDGGGTWYPLDFSGDITMFAEACFVDQNIGFAVGLSSMKARITKTTDAGFTWTTQNIDSIMGFRSIHFVSADTGFVVGNINNVGGKILRTTDGGETWLSQSTPIANTLNSISFTNANTGYAVGLNGSIYKTIDGGISWTPKSSSHAYWFTSVCFPDPEIGYIVSEYWGVDNNTILKTNDGGETWTGYDTGLSDAIEHVYFINAQVGYAVGDGGTILRTINGGALSIKDNSIASPTKFNLTQNYPNPFNPTSSIQYDLPEATLVTLIVYDVLGREVIRLVDQQMQPGYQQVVWDARDHAGRAMPTGIYIARLVTPEYARSIKMLLLK